MTKKVLTQISFRVSMLLFGKIRITLEIRIRVTTILGFNIELRLNLGTSGLDIASTSSNLDPNLPKFDIHSPLHKLNRL